MGRVLEGDERDEFDEFAKLRYIVDRVLRRLDILSNFLCELGREQGETGGAFEEELATGGNATRKESQPIAPSDRS